MEINTLIGNRYLIRGLIASGGMGDVYDAWDQKGAICVAIKILRPDLLHDGPSLARFLREIRAASRLSHRNICEVLDFDIHNRRPYFVMPKLLGKTLAEVLTPHRPLPLSQTVQIVRQILGALTVAHRGNVIHRDLKPSNIFLTSMPGEEHHVRVIDFGISKLVEEGENSLITSTGLVIGTCYYMSPEQATGDAHIDHLTDIYSTGVLLYEMVTGTRPFNGPGFSTVLDQICAFQFLRPRQLNPRISSGLEQIIIRAMAKNAEQRWRSAKDMLLAIDALSHPTGTDPGYRSNSPPSNPHDTTSTEASRACSFADTKVEIPEPKLEISSRVA